jgi:MinD-like ATPase involved in chromosome partitioning or flagellar assembly
MNRVVAVAAAGGSPGVTTLCLALAATSTDPVLLVEADPAGGMAAAYAGVGWNPGLVTLAAATFGSVDQELVREHTQPWRDRVQLLCAPGTATETAATLDALGDRLRVALSQSGQVLVDMGRLWPASPAAGLASSADLVLVVVGQHATSAAATAAAVARTRGLIDTLTSLGQSAVAAVVVGERPYGPDEIADALGVQIIGVIPSDSTGAATLATRSRLVRAASATWPNLVATLTHDRQPGLAAMLGLETAGGGVGA